MGRDFLFLLFLAWSSCVLAANEGPQTFTLDGRLYSDTAQTTPLLDPSVSFTFTILEPTKDCVLYAEVQTTSTNGSAGYFSLQVGSPTGGAASLKRTGSDSGNSMATVFQNNSVINGRRFSTNTACTYTPTAGDIRYVRISVNPSTSVASTLTPDMTFDAVPVAMVAESLQGLSRTDVLAVDSTGQLSQANLSSVFSNSNYPKLTSLLAGNSTQYLSASSSGAGALPSYTTATPPSAPAAGSIWYDSTANSVKFYNGSSTVTLGASGAGLSSLTVSSNLTADGTTGGTLSAPGTIDLKDSGVTANTYTKVTVNAKGIVTSATNITGSDITSGTIGGSTAINTSGNITTTGTVTGATVSGTNVTARNVQYFDADTNKITIQAPALSADYSLTLPTADGSSGQVLSTDGSGTLSWTSAASGAASSVAASSGTNSAPSISFSGDTNTGLYSSAADTIGVAAGGADIFAISSAGIVASTTGGGLMSSANGTSAAPTFSFSGDTDTGWFRPAANTLAASTGGSERARIDSSGNLGIGTTTPAYPLDVNGRIYATGNYIDPASNVIAVHSNPQVTISNPSTSSIYSHFGGTNINSFNTNTGTISGVWGFAMLSGASYTQNQVIGVSGGTRLTTAAASTATSVYGVRGYNLVGDDVTITNAAALRADANTKTGGGTGVYTNNYGVYLEAQTAGANNWQLYSAGTAPSYFAGNVGIGTTSPGSALDVRGTLRLSGSTSGYVGLAPAATAGSTTYTLPSADGSSGQVLSTNGSGVLSWGTAGGATSVAASNGTNSAPSISFSGDPDTGLYSSSANTIGVTAGGSDIFAISSAGLVASTTGGGLMSTANGTAAAPTFSFAGDADTGWFRPAANTLAASTGGSERIRVDSAGLVGIGTTSPTSNLSFGGDSARTIALERATVAASPGNNLTISAGSATSGSTDQVGGDLLLSSGTPTGSGSSKIQFMVSGGTSSGTTDTAPTVKMTLRGNGNLGIGAGNPGSTVHALANGAIIRSESSSGATSTLSNTMTGFETMSRSTGGGEYVGALKFMSTDSDFSTESTKLLALVAGRATENYNSDTRGGMAIDFATAPNGVGATSVPTVRMTINQDGNVGIWNDNSRISA